MNQEIVEVEQQKLEEHFHTPDMMDNMDNAEALPTPKKLKAAKVPKEKEKEKDKANDKNAPISPRFLLQFNMTEFSGDLQIFKESVKRANAKNLGKNISPEMLLSKLIKRIDEDFILEVQKESLSNEEINLIFKSHLMNKTLQ